MFTAQQTNISKTSAAKAYSFRSCSCSRFYFAAHVYIQYATHIIPIDVGIGGPVVCEGLYLMKPETEALSWNFQAKAVVVPCHICSANCSKVYTSGSWQRRTPLV